MTITLCTYEPLDPRRPIQQGLAWYVLTTSPKREFQIAAWLEAQGWSSLVPIENRTRLVSRHGRGQNAVRKPFVAPLVPRIVCFGCSGLVPWLRLTDNYYITGVMGINGTPVPMRPGEIERLRDVSEALLRPKVTIPLKVGGKALVTAPGLWNGHCVEVRSITGKWARVIQKWFGVDTEVRIAVDDLEPEVVAAPLANGQDGHPLGR